MNSLVFSVVLLVVVAILSVAAYNLWLLVRARRLRNKLAGPERGGAGQPGAERGEPTLGLDPVLDSGQEPSLDPSALQMPSAHPRTGLQVLDSYTDCIVELVLPAPVPGERLMGLGNRFRRVGSKPVTLEVATLGEQREPGNAPVDPDHDGGSGPAGAEEALDWRTPGPGGHFRRLRIGVLLANRGGPLNAMEFSEFVAGVHDLADQLSVLADTPEMSGVLARARALDDLCASLDAVVGLGVECGEPLGVEDLATVAAQAGCVERGNNRYARLGPGGEIVFSLALSDAPNRLSLLLDVPRAPASASPWSGMLDCARLCAERLGGRLIDDGGRPVAPEHLDAIAVQLAARQQALEDAGFVAGSSLALRLFN